MPAFNVTHLMLAYGPDFDGCRRQVERFFARTILVKYDSVTVIAEKSCSATDREFWSKLATGIDENRNLAAGLLAELKEAGITELDSLTTLPQGYASKTLHTIAHLLDGFFGVDSRFYNLNDDSHWLNESQQALVKQKPEQFWLLHVEASSQTGAADQVATLRTIPTAAD
ncbi:MAG: hypothetical protein OEV73_01715 [Desulfobulbaceae bacterium]|nr:hypothetical protein [Desulfobulbaceae bacterium]